MEVEDTFNQLPLQIDPQTKAISFPGNSSTTTQNEINQLNSLHRAIVGLSTPNSVPPPPLPVDPKRSGQITKMREAGNTSLRKGAHQDAIRLYSLGIEMALQRPAWEPAGLVREEVSILYSNRAQAHMAIQAWPEASVDAECSLELKKVQNAKAWWRKGRCLVEMGRLEEARDWVKQGLDFEAQEKDLLSLKDEIDTAISRRAKT
jgi:translocation protein SEC72